MPLAERKPLSAPVPMESREPHSIRFMPSEWTEIAGESRSRGLEPAVFVRMLTMYALEDVMRSARVEASLGIPGKVPGGSPRIGRF